jgi:hypothetical protein
MDSPCLILTANPEYWDGRLDVSRVVFRPSGDPGTKGDRATAHDGMKRTGVKPSTPAMRNPLALSTSTRPRPTT